MKKKIFIVSLLVVFLIGVLTLGYSQRPRFAGADNPVPGICKQIPNLTDDQKAKIEVLQLKLKKDMAPKHIQLQKLHLEVKELMLADKPDEKKLDAKLDEISKQQAEIEKARIKHQLAVRELLTEEQRVHFMMPGCFGKCGPDEPGFRCPCGHRGGGKGHGRGACGPVMENEDND